MPGRLKIKKGDQVMIISGKHKGKRGRVLEVLTKKGKVLVEGWNMQKHHERQNR
ncbi:MAG TPA: 50S ribosomal protein L24, partial [Blastocatellia bacterium]|nr:50S ribosomal protein L24 [Blastocatellia bacterium]